MAFEKEKDAILRILYDKDKEIRSKSGLKQSTSKLKYGVSRDDLLRTINSDEYSIDMAIKALYGTYITQSINSGGWGEGKDYYSLKDLGKEFMEDRKSFVKILKSERNQQITRRIKSISHIILTAIAVIIAGLSYLNERSNTLETREKLKAQVDMITQKLDSVARLSISSDRRTIDQTPKYRPQNAKEKHADSINSEISSIAIND